MTLTRLQLEVAAGIAVAIAGIIGAKVWIDEHDARVRAEVQIDADRLKESDAEKRDEALRDEMAKRDEDAKDREQKMLDAVKNLKTPAQIAPYIEHDLAPGSKDPIVVQVPVPTKDNPSPNATISISETDLPVLRDRLSKCDLDADKLNVCKADALTNADRLKAAGEKLSAVENERDQYKTELKGGTFWRRVKTAGKFIGIGGGIAAAALCGSGHCK